MRQDLLTPAEVARLLDVTPETVRGWANAGKIPVLRTQTGRRLFERDQVERLAQERERGRTDTRP